MYRHNNIDVRGDGGDLVEAFLEGVWDFDVAGGEGSSGGG